MSKIDDKTKKPEKYTKKETKELVEKRKSEISDEEKYQIKLGRREMFRTLALVTFISIVIAAINISFTRNTLSALVFFLIAFVLAWLYFVTRKKLYGLERVRKMEEVFPDFIDLVASNLRAGMTIDHSLLVSSRKEFAPLDAEILALGKNILTGREIGDALIDMANKIGSDRISKVVNLINTGIKSGGNLSVILEETASDMRERNFVEKRSASNILMYIIFIVFGVAVGAPLLFALSSVLVEILSQIISNIDLGNVTTNLPIKIGSLPVTTEFITYFSMGFLLVSNILASIVLGIVQKGNERDGIKYIIPLLISTLVVFFVVRGFLVNYLMGLF